MRFSWKVFLSTLVILGVSFGAGGYVLISSVFQTALDREISLALETSQMLRFSFETAVMSLAQKESGPEQAQIKEIAQSLEMNQSNEIRQVRISGGDRRPVYQSKNAGFNEQLLEETAKGKEGWRIFRKDGQSYIQTACMPYVEGQELYLENLRNITSVFEEREVHYRIYRNLMLLILAAGGTAAYLLSLWITKPIQTLAGATREIARGDYQKRVSVRSNDEVGLLAQDFNTMADNLEKKINDLAEAARRQEAFVGSFAHELKTPLTSMIGYADLLRSRTLAPERQFTAAHYIFTEGKRLEMLSRKMMELIVLRRREFQLTAVAVAALFEELAALMEPVLKPQNIHLQVKAGAGTVLGERDLLKTLLINLLDNARKASEENSEILLFGERVQGGYLLGVQDYGAGIPPEELPKITEAFYMVDKSRARANGGAGLGLAICADIAGVHHSRLKFESVLGEGTRVTILLEEGEEGI